MVTHIPRKLPIATATAPRDSTKPVFARITEVNTKGTNSRANTETSRTEPKGLSDVILFNTLSRCSIVITRYQPNQLRTLQRRLKTWRTQAARRLIYGTHQISHFAVEPATLKPDNLGG